MLPEGKCSHLSCSPILMWEKSPSWLDCLIQNSGGCLGKKLTPSHPAFTGRNNAKKNSSPYLWYTDYIIYAWMRNLHLKANVSFWGLIWMKAPFSQVLQVSHQHRIHFTSVKVEELIEHNVFEKENTFPHSDGMIGITNFSQNILYIVDTVKKHLAISDDIYLWANTMSHHLCFWVPDTQHPGKSHAPTTQSQKVLPALAEFQKGSKRALAWLPTSS